MSDQNSISTVSINDGCCSNRLPINSRRDFLTQCGLGIGGLSLGVLMAQEAGATQATQAAASQAMSGDRFVTALSAKQPHFAPKAKRVIHIMASGGPSHLDLLDHKPELKKRDGELYPKYRGVLYGSTFGFNKHGQSGNEFSEILPSIAKHADDIAIIRSMQTDVPSHRAGMYMLTTGNGRLVRPSFGSWVTYGLGTENQNLPGFVSLGVGNDKRPIGSSFLPPVYQGTNINLRPGKYLDNLSNPAITQRQQRRQLDALKALNEAYSEENPHEAELDARIQSYEMAYQMQMSAPEAMGLEGESKKTIESYGKTGLGQKLLVARRLLERGVRVVQVVQGGWDHHNNLQERMTKSATEMDQAVGAFLQDLKDRGLLEDTLVLWAGEFGRTPVRQVGADGLEKGRDHNHLGYSAFMVGGGVKGGVTHGATDELGREAVENPVHVHDLHATMLHCLGFDHKRLQYRHQGREFRLTDVYGNVVKDVLA